MRLLALSCSFLIAACSTSAPLVSTNPELLRIGEKPEGYPKTYLQQIDGHCQQVTESWREREFRGQTIWLKDVSEKTVDCPQARPPVPFH